MLSVLVLFFNKGHKSSNLFLAGVLLFSSLFSLVNFTIFFSNSVFWVAIFETSFGSTFFLIGPLSYFYVRSVLRDNAKLCKWDYLHFLLFLIAFAGTFRFIFTPWEHKLEVARSLLYGKIPLGKRRVQEILPPIINNGSKPFHFAFYVILNWILIFRFNLTLKLRYRYTHQYKLMRNWLYCFNALLMINAIFFTIVMVKFIIYNNNVEFVNGAYLFIILLTVSYVLLNIVLLIFPQILYGLPFELLYEPPLKITLPNVEPFNDVVKEGKLIADDSKEDKKKSPQFYNQEYIGQIEVLLQIAKEEKWFLQPKFLLEHLNKNSHIPTHHLSYYFNNVAKVKFTDWRNELRVEHAIELLEKGTLDSVNYKWIASNSGFSSITTFFRVFKMYTKFTPAEYLMNVNDCKISKEVVNPPNNL